MEDQACPKCKTDIYRNPSMKLMVNVCGHNLCESCVELLFIKGSGSCPECGIALRRNNYRYQIFEDAAIDREVDIRKRILRDFNQKEEDFNSLRAYNDYLEMVETYIFNLTNNIDVSETNKAIAEYKEVNRNLIAKNRHRKSKETIQLEDNIAEEKKIQEKWLKINQLEMIQEKKSKENDKEKLIDDLMFSEANASEIINQHNETKSLEASRAELFNKFRHSENQSSKSVDDFIEDPRYVYVAPVIEHNGPHIPSIEEMYALKYFNHIRHCDNSELAAGFSEKLPCSRAIQEAMCGLFY